MKLSKQIKNRIVAVVMLAVVLVSGVVIRHPEKVKADVLSGHFTITKTLYLSDGSPDVDSDGKQYVYNAFPRCDSTDQCYLFVDSAKFGKKYQSGSVAVMLVRDITKGNSPLSGVLSYDYECVNKRTSGFYGSGKASEFSIDSKKYSVQFALFDGQTSPIQASVTKMYSFDPSGLSSKYGDSSNWVQHLLEVCVGQVDSSFVMEVDSSSTENALPGSQDNPQNDENIGYLVLKTTNTNTQTDLDALKNGIQSVHYNLDWENKTTTGFSLSKNKYARTFIQFEVESQYVVYSDAKHTKVKHKFDNYGERGWIAKNWDATSKPFSLSTDQVNAALPKSTNEVLTQFDQNKIYQTGFTNGNIAINPLAFNFKIRYRVVCTNDITVIPDSSGGWYAGPWASTVIAGDEINDTSSHKSNHEGYGDDKNDNGESDDINHTKTDYDDNQDAKDHINDNSSKSDLDLDSAKEFINQVADVPKMIGDIFSFFPDWVKYCFALGFAFIPILIIYKLIRG